MAEYIVEVVDEVADEIAASTGGDVGAYLQGQVDAVTDQFIAKIKKRAFKAVGLSEDLATAGLDSEQEAILLANASAKKAAAEAEARLQEAEVEAEDEGGGK